MLKNPVNQGKFEGTAIPSFTLALILGLLLLIGSCTSPNASKDTEEASQAQTKKVDSRPSKGNEASPASLANEKSPPTEKLPPAPNPSETVSESKEVLAKGESLYQEHCAKCHGIQGDGQGPLAVELSTKPQNFTKGEYKFRSTMSGELPTDADLLRTISVGVPGTAMESYQELPQPDRLALVAYLKSLSPRFLKSPQGTPIILPEALPPTPESLTHGRQLYNEMQCAACHGPNGGGNGELAKELTDTDGNPIQPADLTRKRLKSGDGPGSIYRTIMTGLDGTPMPSYGYALAPGEGWDLALYIYSLANKKDME